MARLLEIWRSWSVRRRLITVGGVALLVAGAALGAYLALKRPADVSNPDAAFHEEKRQMVKTVDWPLYGYDAQRTRYLPTNKVNPPFQSSQWSFQAGKLLEFSPIAAKGNLYLMDKDALFYALSADRGKVRWKHKIGTLNASAPAYADGTLFAVTLQPDQVVALDAKKRGKVIWRHPLPGRSESSPLVHQGKVIFGSESGDVFALDAKTGRERWRVHTSGAVKGGVAYDNGNVFAGNYGGEMVSIDVSNGHVNWTAQTQGGSFLRGGGIYSTPAVAWGRVYAGSLDGRVYSFVEKTGQLAWSHSTGAEVYPAPAVADTPDSPPTVYIGSADKNFYAINARSGAVRWSHPVGGVVIGASSVVGKTAYVAGIGPNVGTFGYDTGSGKEVFQNDQGEYNPVISDGQKLFLTGTSTLRAFKPRPPGSGGHKQKKQPKKKKSAK